MKDDPIQADLVERMNALAFLLEEEALPGWGFALLVFPFGKEGRMNYISNAERSDMVKAMKEFIARNDDPLLATPAPQAAEPVAWINWNALTGERSVSFQRASDLASEPLYAAPPSERSSDHV